MTLLTPPNVTSSPATFADRLRDHGGRPALLHPSGTLSYTELAERVDAVVARLGAERRLVVLEAANRLEAVIGYLAALRGRHPVLVAPAATAPAAAGLVEAYDPDVVLGADDGWRVIERRAGSGHDLHPDLALLLSTSGSTGSPKLVRLSHTNLQSNAEAIASYLGLTGDDRAITSLPLQYCYGLSVLNSHLTVGASVVLTEESVVEDRFWDLFEATAATSFAGVPHTFALLERTRFVERRLPSLRTVTQAGGRLAPDAVRRLSALGEKRGWRFFVMYGQTEATARMAYLPPDRATAAPDSIGLPIPGGSFRIAAPDEGGVGELVYRGPNVMMGYAHGTNDLASGPTLDELRTGDLARRRDDGLYEIVGRRSRFVKPFGVRVDLDRLEHALAAAGIDAMCAGDDDHVAVGVTAADTDTDTATAAGDGERVAAARELVAGITGLAPSRIGVAAFEELPRLPNGKPDHASVLAAAATAPAAPPAAARPGPAAEDGVAEEPVRAAFVAVLGRDPGDDDTFAGLGGDSLSYVEMSIRLEELLGGLPADWPSLPVASLARHARRQTSTPDEPGSPRPSGTGRPARARSRGGSGRRRSAVARMETSVVLRAVGIVLIVGGHTDIWELPGAAHILLAVAGFNFARFQLGAGLSKAGAMAASIARVAVPSMLWIGMAAAATDQWEWKHALLVNAQLGDRGARWGYWYVEALVQVLVVLAVVFAIPAVRRIERRRPFAVASTALAMGLAVRFDVVPLPGMHHRIMRPHEVFWVFALGWAAARARTTRQRLVVTAAALAAVPGFFGQPWRDATVVAGFLAVVWLPTVPVPRVATGAVGTVAGASLYIYLTHWQVLGFIEHLPGTATVVSLAVGVAVAAVARRAIGWTEETTRVVFSEAAGPRRRRSPQPLAR